VSTKTGIEQVVPRTKDFEDVFGKLHWVTEREELLVDACKLFLVELTGGTVLEETFVPVIIDSLASASQALLADYKAK
jgi:hypothetical protein